MVTTVGLVHGVYGGQHTAVRCCELSSGSHTALRVLPRQCIFLVDGVSSSTNPRTSKALKQCCYSKPSYEPATWGSIPSIGVIGIVATMLRNKYLLTELLQTHAALLVI